MIDHQYCAIVQKAWRPRYRELSSNLLSVYHLQTFYSSYPKQVSQNTGRRIAMRASRVSRIIQYGGPYLHDNMTSISVVSRVHKRSLRLIFIDLRKASGSVEICVIMEALNGHCVPFQYLKFLRKLCRNFTTEMAPFYNDVLAKIIYRNSVVGKYTIFAMLMTSFL